MASRMRIDRFCKPDVTEGSFVCAIIECTSSYNVGLLMLMRSGDWYARR